MSAMKGTETHIADVESRKCIGRLHAITSLWEVSIGKYVTKDHILPAVDNTAFPQWNEWKRKMKV